MIKTGAEWDLPTAVSTYNIDRWGGGYFSINSKGHIQATPQQSKQGVIDFMDLIEEAQSQGLTLPLLIRFQDLLRHRVETICKTFANAIEQFNYKSPYRGVFPIKVNQLREVVEEILDAGQPYHYGLEAGSKPELLAALAVHRDPESLIICNGYKDSAFVQNVMLGRKLGKSVILVVEKLEELVPIIQIAKQYQVLPYVGFRVRLNSKGAGKWAESGGEDAKFGLSTADLVTASDLLKAHGIPEALRLIHFHVGSQVPDIGIIKSAVREGARFYAKLVKRGHERLDHIDVGGGLGVDYDGSRSAFESSMNYSLQEYARDVVYNIMEVCDSEQVPHPTIVSESGRALVAHHSVLIVEALSAIEKHNNEEFKLSESDQKLVQDIYEVKKSITKENRLESLHDARQLREQAQSMFDLGYLDLDTKAKVETIYWEIARSVVQHSSGMRYIPEEVRELENSLSEQYICNFSIFQSLPDHWALGQLFPVMPVHRLDTPPERDATVVDITCDSDGKIKKFVDLQDVKDTLPLHDLRPNEPYYLGIFLVGAYQDIMGDLHNLFGRVNEVHVFLDDDEESGYYIEEIIEGSPISEVLSMTQWHESDLARLMKAQIDAAIKSDRLKPSEAMRLLNNYEKSLRGYTYLNVK